MAGEDDRIEVVVHMTDELSRPAKRVEDALDKLEDQTRDNTDATDELSKAQKDLGSTSKSVAKDHDALAKSTEKVGKAARTASRDVNQMQNSLSRIKRLMNNAGQWGSGFFNSFFTTFQAWRVLFTDLAGMIPVIISGVRAIGAAVISLGAPIAKLAGNAGMIAPAIVSAAQAMITLKMAFKGIGGAISALNTKGATPEQIAEAFKELGPNATRFAKALAPVAKRFAGIQKMVQETFLGQKFTKSVTNLGSKAFPILNKNLKTTARYLRDGLTKTFDRLSTPGNMKLLDALTKSGARNAKVGGGILGSFGESFLKIATAAAPAFEKVLKNIAKSAEKFAENLDVDKMTKFFESARKQGQEFWGGLKNFGGGMKGVFQAGSGLGDWLSGGLGGMMEDFNKWANSDTGQADMKKFFDEQKPILTAMGDVLGAVWDGLGTVGDNEQAVKFLDTLATKGVPALFDAFAAIDANVTPQLTRILDSLGTVDSGTMFKPLGDLLSGIAGFLEKAVPIFNDMPEGTKNMLAYMAGAKALGLDSLFFGAFGKNGGGAGGDGGVKSPGGIVNSVLGRAGAQKVYWSSAMPVTVLGGVGLPGKNGKGVPVPGKPGRSGRPGAPIPGKPGTTKPGRSPLTKGRGFGGVGLILGALGLEMALDPESSSAEAMGGGAVAGGFTGGYFAGPVGAGVGVLLGLTLGLYQHAMNNPDIGAMKEQVDTFKASDTSAYQNSLKMYDDLKRQNPGYRDPDVEAQLINTQSELARNGRRPGVFTSPSAPQQTQTTPLAGVNTTITRSANGIPNRAVGSGVITSPSIPSAALNQQGVLKMNTTAVDDASSKVGQLGTKVKNLPNKNITVNADTGPANAAIDALMLRNLVKYVSVVASPLGPLLSGPMANINAAQEAEGRWTGGPVMAGNPYVVGELGREIFVDRSGAMGLVGVNGPEMGTFNREGYILPNDTTEALLSAQNRGGGLGHQEGAERPADGYTDPMPRVLITGNTFTNDIDVERAVSRGIARAERERKERR